LTQAGAKVRVIMTANACHFVGPMTFEALSGIPVSTSLWKHSDSGAIQHIDWAREADAVVIAPATANFLGKLAGGIADDALTTLMLAVTAPVMICPAMNTHMYAHAAVQRNLKILSDDGYHILDPDAGELACGTTGPGRLPDPEIIFDRLIAYLTPKDLQGRTILVTAGPTREIIDPVRFISNPSSGKMGFAVARAAEQRGAKVILVTGPTSLPDPLNMRVLAVETAAQMQAAVFEHLDDVDIVVKTAAVGDFRPVESVPQKIKKEHSEETTTLALVKNPDILKAIGERKNGRFIVGFAAETNDVDEWATHKLAAKKLDMIAANIIGAPDAGFASDTNRVTFFYPDGSNEALPKMSKDAVAHTLLDRIVARLANA
jgi:phosphopantothenoylcysteine decarboxylase/phosphopantothenate--cysteine ligase